MKKIDISLNELAMAGRGDINYCLQNISNDLNGTNIRRVMMSLQNQFSGAPNLRANCSYAARCFDASIKILEDSCKYISESCSLYSNVDLPGLTKVNVLKEEVSDFADKFGALNKHIGNFSKPFSWFDKAGSAFEIANSPFGISEYVPEFGPFSKISKGFGIVNHSVKGYNILINDVWNPDASTLRNGSDAAAAGIITVGSYAAKDAVSTVVSTGIADAFATGGSFLGPFGVVAGAVIGPEVGSIVSDSLLNKHVVGTLGGGIEAIGLLDTKGAWNNMCSGTRDVAVESFRKGGTVGTAWREVGESENVWKGIENTYSAVKETITQTASVAATAVAGGVTTVVAGAAEIAVDFYNEILYPIFVWPWVGENKGNIFGSG